MYLQPVQKGVGGPDALNHCIIRPGDAGAGKGRRGQAPPRAEEGGAALGCKVAATRPSTKNPLHSMNRDSFPSGNLG